MGSKRDAVRISGVLMRRHVGWLARLYEKFRNETTDNNISNICVFSVSIVLLLKIFNYLKIMFYFQMLIEHFP